MPKNSDITVLLGAWRAGHSEAGDALMRAVYQQLHAIAGRQLSAEKPGLTLQTSDLVHEAYLRLAGSGVNWNDRVHFFAIASRVMRRILVDHARARLRDKRGGGARRVPLDEVDEPVSLDDASLSRMLALDEALQSLSEIDVRKGQAIEMTFFGGMTREETAAAMDISLATLHREMKLAKAWLNARLAEGASPGGA